jgi:hypothetical protein
MPVRTSGHGCEAVRRPCAKVAGRSPTESSTNQLTGIVRPQVKRFNTKNSKEPKTNKASFTTKDVIHKKFGDISEPPLYKMLPDYIHGDMWNNYWQEETELIEYKSV